MANELLPCPFCGASAEMDTRQGCRAFRDGALVTRIAAYCLQCSADMGVCLRDVPDITPDQVADMWNRRAALAATRSDGALIQDMAMLIKRMAAAMRRYGGFGDSTSQHDRAMEFLRSHGLLGSPLRGDEAAPLIAERDALAAKLAEATV